MKYKAFKLKHLNQWVWFKSEKVKEENDRIIAMAGWFGYTRDLISMDVHSTQVEGRIDLQIEDCQ